MSSSKLTLGDISASGSAALKWHDPVERERCAKDVQSLVAASLSVEPPSPRKVLEQIAAERLDEDYLRAVVLLAQRSVRNDVYLARHGILERAGRVGGDAEVRRLERDLAQVLPSVRSASAKLNKSSSRGGRVGTRPPTARSPSERKGSSVGKGGYAGPTPSVHSAAEGPFAAQLEPVAARMRLKALMPKIAEALQKIIRYQHEERLAPLGLMLDSAIRIIAHNSLIPLAALPSHAEADLWTLRVCLDARSRDIDARLVKEWGRGDEWWQRDYPRHAARAGERLMMCWLARRHRAPVIDLSARQVEADDALPEVVACALEELTDGRRAVRGKVALPADAAVIGSDGRVKLYDAKNSVRTAERLEIFVRAGKLDGEPVTYVGTWTEGDVEFRCRASREVLRNAGIGDAEVELAYDTLSQIRVWIIGETDTPSLAEFNHFISEAAPSVAFGHFGGGRASICTGSGGSRLPAFAFTFPEDAQADGGAKRAEAMRTAPLAARFAGTLASSVLGAVADGGPPVGLSDSEEVSFAEWFVMGLRLRGGGRASELPRLGEVYALALEAFVRAVERHHEAAHDSVRGPLLRRLPELFSRLCIPCEKQPRLSFPLGIWDPAQLFRRFVDAVDLLVRNAEPFRDMPRIRTLWVTESETVIAVTPEGFYHTLLARCVDCHEWPLVRGVPVMGAAGASGLTNACSTCGALICSKGHGCKAHLSRAAREIINAGNEAAASPCLAVRLLELGLVGKD